MPKEVDGRKNRPQMPPERKSLYTKWVNTPKESFCPEWQTFQPFYDYWMAQGYVLGERLHRLDPLKPFGPDNCVMRQEIGRQYFANEEKNWMIGWNRTVNVIRRYYGMEPFPEEMEEDDGQT